MSGTGGGMRAGASHILLPVAAAATVKALHLHTNLELCAQL